MNNPWAFGWTQLLTIFGLLLTGSIATAGFRTFGKWKREKLEEKRIDAAIEALTLAYESKFIFDYIRRSVSYEHEWKDMPTFPGDSEDVRRSRGPFFAVLKRIDFYKEFFDRAWKVQVRCAAIFGGEVEAIFLLVQKARQEVEISAESLMQDPVPTVRSEDNIETWKMFKSDVTSSYAKHHKRVDTVGEKLIGFKPKLKLCAVLLSFMGTEVRAGLLEGHGLITVRRNPGRLVDCPMRGCSAAIDSASPIRLRTLAVPSGERDLI